MKQDRKFTSTTNIRTKKFIKSVVLVKKYNFIIVCFLIFIVLTSMIDLFRTITGFNEINKKLESISKQTKNLITSIQKNQLNTEKIVSGFSLQINNKITELSEAADTQAGILGTALDEVRTSSLLQIEEVKSLIASYTEEVKNKKASENLLVVNALVESDILIQQLLSEGSVEYGEEDFTAAVKVYRNVLDIDPSNAEALCYFNASLYYQNPGDESKFSGLKKNLIPLLEGNLFPGDKELSALNVLLGISREEGDSVSIKQYQDALKKLEESRK